MIDRRVGLQEVFVAAVAGVRRPALRADDAHRHRLSDAEGIAHGEHDVAHFDRIGVAERDRFQVAGVDLEQREVARLVGADHLGAQRAAVGQIDFDFIGAVDDVIVRQDVAVGRHDDARSERALFEAARRRAAASLSELPAEELSEEVVVGQLELRGGNLRLPLCVNRHHGRRDHVDDVGVGIASAGNGVRDRSRHGRNVRGGLAVGGNRSPGGAADQEP